MDAAALKFTLSPSSGAEGDVRKLAVGPAPPATSSVCVVMALRLYWSLTVSVTAYVPGRLNECVAVRPLPVEPSPKFQEYDVIGLFAGAHDRAGSSQALKSTTW